MSSVQVATDSLRDEEINLLLPFRRWPLLASEFFKDTGTHRVEDTLITDLQLTITLIFFVPKPLPPFYR